LAEYVEAVHEAGGDVLIHQGHYLQVKRAHTAKERCLENMEETVTAPTLRQARQAADRTGHFLAGHIVELGLSYDESSFSVIQLDNRLAKSSELLGHVAEGFRSSIESRFYEDEEQWPANHNSVEQRAERERFCDLFSAHLADLVEKTQRSSVGHGLQAEELKQGVELAM
jgi:hypothetical protein